MKQQLILNISGHIRLAALAILPLLLSGCAGLGDESPESADSGRDQ